MSNPIAHVRLDPSTNEIEVRSKTSQALNIYVTNIYVYSDPFHTELLATCRVEVTPLQCMYVKTHTGIDNPLTLTMPAFAPQKVSIHSDRPEILKEQL